MNKEFIKNIFSTAANLARFEPMGRHHIQKKLISAHNGKNPNYNTTDAIREYSQSMKKTIISFAKVSCYGLHLTVALTVAEALLQHLILANPTPEWQIIPLSAPTATFGSCLAALGYIGIMEAKAFHLRIFHNAGAKRVVNRMVKRTAKRLEKNRQSLLTQG